MVDKFLIELSHFPKTGSMGLFIPLKVKFVQVFSAISFLKRKAQFTNPSANKFELHSKSSYTLKGIHK